MFLDKNKKYPHFADAFSVAGVLSVCFLNGRWAGLTSQELRTVGKFTPALGATEMILQENHHFEFFPLKD